jgi:transposase-like protein
MSRKRHAKEFKIEAVKQVTKAGYSAHDVAERLQVVPTVESGGISASC